MRPEGDAVAVWLGPAVQQLTPEEREKIAAHKPAMLAILHAERVIAAARPEPTEGTKPEPADSAPAPAPERKCWRRGAAGSPPSPVQQVAAIRAIQAGQPSVFQWTESQLARLENRMAPGDFVVTVRTEEVEVQRPDGALYSHFKADA
jgi:hypothetical protein